MGEPHNHYSKSKKPDQKTTHHIIPFIKNVQKRQIYKDKKKTKKNQISGVGWDWGLIVNKVWRICGNDENFLKLNCNT